MAAVCGVEEEEGVEAATLAVAVGAADSAMAGGLAVADLAAGEKAAAGLVAAEWAADTGADLVAVPARIFVSVNRKEKCNARLCGITASVHAAVPHY